MRKKKPGMVEHPWQNVKAHRKIVPTTDQLILTATKI
jgi:hypothetical protein